MKIIVEIELPVPLYEAFMAEAAEEDEAVECIIEEALAERQALRDEAAKLREQLAALRVTLRRLQGGTP